jgi:ABC-type transporter Mla maintaining outer membrane lipid asymmetry permease subunit MlaE
MYHIIVWVASAIGFVGGVLGIVVFIDWRKKRAFIEYMNNRLSRKKRGVKS